MAGPSTGQWKRRPVTVSGSAHSSTRFQIQSNNTSYNATVLLFFNPLGHLCAAVASFVERDSDGKCELQWSLSDFEPEIKTLPDYPVDFKTVFPSPVKHDMTWANSQGIIKTIRFHCDIPETNGELVMN
jgi:hypothetical protein